MPGFVLSFSFAIFEISWPKQEADRTCFETAEFQSELVSDIYNQLLEDKLFGKAYHDFKVTGKVNMDKVTSDLKKENQRLSESTLRRRASTIRSWVEWMYGIDKVNEMNPLFQARKNQKKHLSSPEIHYFRNYDISR